MAAFGYMATSAVLFALMNFFAKRASASSSWMMVGAVRALVGAVVAVAVARARGVSLVANDRLAIFWRSLLGTAAMMATFYALSSRTLSLGDTVTLLNLTPVFLAVFAPIFLRERTTWAVAIALLLALSGVVLVLHPTFEVREGTVGPSSKVTAAAAVLAAFLASIAMMLLRRLGTKERAEAVSFRFSLFAAATLGLLSLTDRRMPTLEDAGSMIAAGVAAGFAQITMTHAYSLERATRVSAVSYLSIVASALLGLVFLHERTTPAALFGMSLVIASGLVIAFTRDA